MSEQGYRFVDRTGAGQEKTQLIPSVLIKRAEVEAEVERLAGLPAPANGRRVSMVSYPAAGAGDGLTPGIAVSLCVLKPGESTRPVRHNSFLVDFCIRGAGRTEIEGRRIDYKKYDVWTTPPWSVYRHFNDTDELQVRLSYSNSPLLEKLQVYVVDENPEMSNETEDSAEAATDPARVSPYGTLRLTGDGAYLMPYEKLVNPDRVEIRPLHWPREMVKDELDQLRTLGRSYGG